MPKETPSEIICARAKITGKVQGVGYRYSTVREAEKLHLGGWVRNLPDGSVEAIFEGDRPAVTTILQWCQHGPVAAIVKNVTIDYEVPIGLQKFTIKH
jgi:acylphosphatase